MAEAGGKAHDRPAPRARRIDRPTGHARRPPTAGPAGTIGWTYRRLEQSGNLATGCCNSFIDVYPGLLERSVPLAISDT
jgi:hypothetical protein